MSHRVIHGQHWVWVIVVKIHGDPGNSLACVLHSRDGARSREVARSSWHRNVRYRELEIENNAKAGLYRMI